MRAGDADIVAKRHIADFRADFVIGDGERAVIHFIGWAQVNRHALRSGKLVDRVGDVALSQRELDIIRRVADGHSNKIIAKDLAITEATVKVHLKTVLRKLGAANRTQVAIWAVQHGLTNGGNGSPRNGRQRP